MNILRLIRSYNGIVTCNLTTLSGSIVLLFWTPPADTLIQFRFPPVNTSDLILTDLISGMIQV